MNKSCWRFVSIFSLDWVFYCSFPIRAMWRMLQKQWKEIINFVFECIDANNMQYRLWVKVCLNWGCLFCFSVTYVICYNYAILQSAQHELLPVHANIPFEKENSWCYALLWDDNVFFLDVAHNRRDFNSVFKWKFFVILSLVRWMSRLFCRRPRC